MTNCSAIAKSFHLLRFQTEMNYVRPPDEMRYLFKTVILNLDGDDYYKKVVNISYLISFIAFCVTICGYFYLNNHIQLFKKNNLKT